MRGWVFTSGDRAEWLAVAAAFEIKSVCSAINEGMITA
jgi:hypothetical protein